MTTYVTITSDPQSHWNVDLVRVDGGNDQRLATLAPGETHSDHIWMGARIEIREADPIKKDATP